MPCSTWARRKAPSIATDRVGLATLELSRPASGSRPASPAAWRPRRRRPSVVAARNALIQARASYGVARITLYQSLGVLDRLQ